MSGAAIGEAASPGNETPGPWRQSAILAVDDEEGMRSFLSRALASRCGLVETAASAEEAARLMERCHFDVVILDIALPGKQGIDWLKELREQGFQGDVILITAFADLETAIDAVRGGASDYILKPFRLDQIVNSIQRCLDRARLARENFLLRREVAEHGGDEGLVGESPAVLALRLMLRRLAAVSSTVLIQGESGTGKEVAARALHRMSPRAERPFVPVNCAAIPAEMLESELFGHTKGAFTGASEAHNGLFFYAQGGTLFLDEIGDLPLPMQTKLLRALEERRIRPVGSDREIPVDVRIVAATNRSLAPEVAAGRFRQDLFYRLDVVSITIPPLRERREDIAPLARHFLHQISTHIGVPPLTLDEGVLARMRDYDWPGNARELRNLIERWLILGQVPLESLGVPPLPARAAPPEPAVDTALPLDEVEKRHILAVLESVGGNKSEAARRLGVSRKTLERKCAIWGAGR